MSIKNKQSGFTIVELLIVIVVIAILATITFVAYGGIQRSAAEATLKSDLRGASRQLDVAQIEQGSYPDDAYVNEIQASDDTTLEYTSEGETFCLTASSERAGTAFYVTEGNVIEEGPCDGHDGFVESGVDTLEFEAISAGNSHTCAIADGKVYCWGGNYYGQNGNGSSFDQNNTPVSVDDTTMSGVVTSISAGNNSHTCAIADGKAYCWGNNGYGRLGNGSTVNRHTPVAVDTSLMSGTVTSISAGDDHTCAIADGQAYCWGRGSASQLGNDSTDQQHTPVAVDTSLMSGTVTSISASKDRHTCAVASGQAYCWGSNSTGQLGDGSTNLRSTPVLVDTSTMSGTVSYIATGIAHTCAVASGQAYCWGVASSGQLGNGQTVGYRNTPVAADTSNMSSTLSSISTGNNHTCAVASGQAYCWGRGSSGELGDGSATGNSNPLSVDTSLMSGTVKVASAGNSYTCAIADSKSYCWGDGEQGRLGNNLTTQQSAPVLVSPLP